VRRILFAGASSLAAVALLVGCAQLSVRTDPPETAAPSSAEPVASTSSATPEPEPAEVREFWEPQDWLIQMPKLIGLTPDEAEIVAEDLGFELVFRDLDGDRPWIVVSDNWVVVAQDEAPEGTNLSANSIIDFTVMKKDDPRADKLIVANSTDPKHALERRFTGYVTAYGAAGEGLPTTVMVDEAVVEIDLIQPVPDGCSSSAGYAGALQAKERTIPIGTRVLVERAELRGGDAYLHLVDGGVPAAGETAGSVNELLVRSGWWTPESAFQGGLGSMYDKAVFVGFEPATYWSHTRLAYAQAIAVAGNEVTPHIIEGGIAECRRIAETDQAEYAVVEAERKREFDRWYAEYERRVASGYYSCRDGDGDGVCYER